MSGRAAMEARALAVLELRRRGYKRPVRVIEEMRRYALGPPAAYMRDKLGIRLTAQQEALTERIKPGAKEAWPAANGTGKTYLLGAIALFVYDCRGSLPDPEGHFQERGARVLLGGPTHGVIEQGVYAEMLLHIERARRLGHQIPGTWSARSVRMSVRPAWNVEAFAPRPSASLQVTHSASGRHQREQIAILDEGIGISEPVWRAFEGMCSTDGNIIIAASNPTEAATAVSMGFVGRATDARSGYSAVHLSAFDHPNILNRRPVVESAIGFAEIDRRVRAQCRDMGPARGEGAVAQDSHQGDFLYALPPSPEALERGPREDGIPGHPDGEVRVYRPNGVFEGQTLGRFPSSSNTLLFGKGKWDAAVERWQARQPPTGPPDRAGVDAAEWGADDIMTVPCWGEDTEELLLQLDALMSSFDERGLARLKDQRRVYCGMPVRVPKGTGDEIARFLVGQFGRAPYLVDSGGGGYRILEGLERLRLPGQVVEFGGPAPPSLPGELYCANVRTALYVRAAMLLEADLIDLPPDPELRKQAFAHTLEWTKGGTVLDPLTGQKLFRSTVRLRSKDDIKRALGCSPDISDAWVLSLWGGVRMAAVGARVVGRRKRGRE